MPSLEDHHSYNTTKALILGHSGTGKTGSLASLARAGYNLRIADFDNGTDLLKSLLSDDLPALRRVHYIPFQDEFHATANGISLIPKTASAWPSFIKALSNWESLGSVESWTDKDVLVIDSLNLAGRAAVRCIQQMNGKLAVPPGWDDYYAAQRLVENLCAKLYSISIRCNVICNTHIREVGKREEHIDDKGRVKSIEIADTIKGFPETGTGRALSPTIGKYFNTVLLTDTQGTGLGTKYVLRTVPWGNIGVKNSAPKKVNAQYPIETGLADYFKAVRAP